MSELRFDNPVRIKKFADLKEAWMKDCHQPMASDDEFLDVVLEGFKISILGPLLKEQGPKKDWTPVYPRFHEP